MSVKFYGTYFVRHCGRITSAVGAWIFGLDNGGTGNSGHNGGGSDNFGKHDLS